MRSGLEKPFNLCAKGGVLDASTLEKRFAFASVETIELLDDLLDPTPPRTDV
jgi:hypothetical protein